MNRIFYVESAIPPCRFPVNNDPKLLPVNFPIGVEANGFLGEPIHTRGSAFPNTRRYLRRSSSQCFLGYTTPYSSKETLEKSPQSKYYYSYGLRHLRMKSLENSKTPEAYSMRLTSGAFGILVSLGLALRTSFQVGTSYPKRIDLSVARCLLCRFPPHHDGLIESSRTRGAESRSTTTDSQANYNSKWQLGPGKPK